MHMPTYAYIYIYVSICYSQRALPGYIDPTLDRKVSAGFPIGPPDESELNGHRGGSFCLAQPWTFTSPKTYILGLLGFKDLREECFGTLELHSGATLDDEGMASTFPKIMYVGFL